MIIITAANPKNRLSEKETQSEFKPQVVKLIDLLKNALVNLFLLIFVLYSICHS